MTRTGKIARLPRAIRDKLNSRLRDGEKGKKLVRWLNSAALVQIVLKEEFSGRPINETNLTDWKQGGYRDWLDQQEAKEFVTRMAAEADELKLLSGLPVPLADQMAVWLAARLMVVVRRLAAADLDDAAKWKLLHEAAADVAAFRKGDHSRQRLKLDRDLLEIDRERVDLDRERLVIESNWSLEKGVEILTKVIRKAITKDPSLYESFEKLRKAIADNADPAVKSYVPPSERKSPWASAAGEAVQSGAPTESNQIKVN